MVVVEAPLGDPSVHRHGHQRTGGGGTVLRDESVGGRRRTARCFSKYQSLPVLLVSDLPIVAARRVAAPAVDWKVDLSGERGVGEVHAVDVGADRVSSGCRVHRESRPGGRLRRRSRCGGTAQATSVMSSSENVGCAPPVVSCQTIPEICAGAPREASTRLLASIGPGPGGGPRRRAWRRCRCRR